MKQEKLYSNKNKYLNTTVWDSLAQSIHQQSTKHIFFKSLDNLIFLRETFSIKEFIVDFF